MKIIGMCLAVLMLIASSAVAAVDAPRMATASGQITSIDTVAKALVVKVADPRATKSDVTFILADDSKIIKDGAAVGLDDLKQGDKVTVTYRAEDGKNVVVNIGVGSKT